MNKFEIGEIAVFIGSDVDEPGIGKYINEDCEICDELGSSFSIYGPQYGVRFLDGVEAWVMPQSLRKKKPPQESKDIRDTREKGATSFDKMMDDLIRKPVRVEE